VVHVLEATARVAGKAVLEVGCGSGVDAVELARRGARVTAVDFSDRALDTARQNALEASAALRLVRADAHRLPFADGVFDIVYSQGVLEHFPDIRPAFHEQLRVLRAGGYILVDVPQRYTLYTVLKHRAIRRGTWFAGWETEYSVGDLRRLFAGAGVAVVSAYGRDYSPQIIQRLRCLHQLGEGRFGRPILPGPLRRFWEVAARAVELRWCRTGLATRLCVNVGLLGRKPSA